MKTQAVYCVLGMIFGALIPGWMPAAQDAQELPLMIQGKLTGANGHALPGLRSYSLKFFDLPQGGTPFAPPVSGQVVISAAGRFAIEIPPAPQLIQAQGPVYIELAIDSSPTPDGGIGPADVFPHRVKIGSVLHALKAGQALTAESAGQAHYADEAGFAWDAVHTTYADHVTSALYVEEVENVNKIGGKSLADLMPRTGPAFLIVQVGENATSNGLNLLQAYAQAKTLIPYKRPRGYGNRITVLVPPGRYDLGTRQLTLDLECIDLAGLSTARGDQFITGTSNGPGTGVICQKANNVCLENLTVECTYQGSGNLDDTRPAAYFPDFITPDTVVRNCEFIGRNNGLSTRLSVYTYFETLDQRDFRYYYSGTYIYCKGGEYAFGGPNAQSDGYFQDCEAGNHSYGKYANGWYVNCTGAHYSFGEGGDAGGLFVNCTAGSNSFGKSAYGRFTNCTGTDYCFAGGDGNASGVFTRCKGDRNCFGGTLGKASGTFNFCEGSDSCFGGSAGTASGTFNFCKANNGSFGGNNGFTGGIGVASGTFIHCTGGACSFAGARGTASGKFTDCTGGDGSFGGYRGTASGQFVNCTGGNASFGGGYPLETEDWPAGTASGTFENCTGGNDAFGGLGPDFSTQNARLRGCQMTGFLWRGVFRGRMENCRWETGLTLGGAARIYGSTVLGTLDLAGTPAGVCQSRARDIINDAANSLGPQAGNIADPDIN